MSATLYTLNKKLNLSIFLHPLNTSDKFRIRKQGQNYKYLLTTELKK